MTLNSAKHTDIESLIYGSQRTQGIVAVEYNRDGKLELFVETPSGVTNQAIDAPLYLITDRPTEDCLTLEGNLPLKYLEEFRDEASLWMRRNRTDNALKVYDNREAALIRNGHTFFKGLTPSQVSVLSFDIEATGIEHNSDSRVLLISNTFRRNGNVERKLFAYDDYETPKQFFEAWVAWVVEKDPSLVIGHNIFTYDLPYIQWCASRAGAELTLGRDGSELRFNKYDSHFRRDGTQFYTFRAASIYGRTLVDTFFTAIKYDVGRKYESYALKSIVRQEGLEVQGRQFYDASTIRHNYKTPAEWEKIKRYAEHDADDSLALFDLMIPAFFYLAQTVPMPFQTLMVTASGRQINNILLRAYLQSGHSLPLASPAQEYEGAISIGNPGIYHNVFKVDVASLYPSIILEYGIYNQGKDPLGVFLKVLKHLTGERLANKKRAKETGDRHYKDMSEGQKIIINSVYGMQGTPGLNFNMPECAGEVTSRGREILNKAIEFATGEDYEIVNADTDSISITAQWDNNPWETESQREYFLKKLNSQYPDRIRWEDDGVYDHVLVLKIKNYVLDRDGKRTIKGSALKATLKEPALREFIGRVIDALITGKQDQISRIYNEYVFEILDLKDISRWSSKKTITESVLNPGRTNEEKVLAALEGAEYAEGDKKYFYFRTDDTLALAENWKGDHSSTKLLEKLYKTLLVFKPVFPDVAKFPNYKLKKNKSVLNSFLTNTVDKSLSVV